MYILQLKERDHFKILAVFYLLIALMFIFDFSFTGKDGIKDWIFAGVSLIATIFLIIVAFFQKKLGVTLTRHLSILLFISAVLMGGAIYFWSKNAMLLAPSHLLLSGVVILIWIFLKKRVDGEKIIVDEKHIILPGLFVYRIVLWSELTNLVKKHDLLTLDFKNNKLLQTELINEDAINEEEFNRFCQAQLDASMK